VDNEDLKIFNENFRTNISNKQNLKGYIYIIVEPPTTTVEEIIMSIMQSARRIDTSTSKLLDKIYMPLQQRNFKEALNKIKENTSVNVNKMEEKSNY
ncbi:32330_t:CDS:2, partial [Racocetra persica]